MEVFGLAGLAHSATRRKNPRGIMACSTQPPIHPSIAQGSLAILKVEPHVEPARRVLLERLVQGARLRVPDPPVGAVAPAHLERLRERVLREELRGNEPLPHAFGIAA